MTATHEAATSRSAAPEGGRRPPAWWRDGRWGERVTLAAPAAGAVALAFDSGGFFAGAVGTAAAVAAAAVAIRFSLGRRPFDALGPWAAVVIGAIAAFGAWTLASAIWSDAPARAIVEADRVLLYGLAVLLVATVPRSWRSPGLVVGGLCAAAVVVCGAAFVSRALPEVLSVAPNVENRRLSYPLTYWNALGLLAAMGLVLALHVAAGARTRTAQVLGTAALPVLAATLVLTFSRASVAVAAVGLLAYAAIGRPRGLLGALLAAGPAVAVVVAAALGADELATVDPTTPAAVEQGGDLARTVLLATLFAALVRLALTKLDDLVAVGLRLRRRRRIAGGLAAAAGVAALAVALAAGAAGAVEERVDEFFADESVITRDQPVRERLLSASSHNRVLIWEASLDEYRADRLQGSGAGTFRLTWDERRPEGSGGQPLISVVDGHSLYLEVLGELGLPGLLALLAVLGSGLVALARLVQGPERGAWAALLVMAAVWAVHAGADWDWEMPAVTLPVFVAFGAAVARPRRTDGGDARPTGWPVRAAAVVGCALLAVVPVQVARSQERLDDAVRALIAGDCGTAIDRAASARAALGVRPEPDEVLGICLARLGRGADAERALERAVGHDPANWELHYELALVRALSRKDPRDAARRAFELNPQDPLTAATVEALDTGRPDRWRAYALSAPLPGLSSKPPGPDASESPSAGGPAAERQPPGEPRKRRP